MHTTLNDDITETERSYAYIHKTNIINNLQVIKKANPNKKIIAMLKANAYGHGAVEVAKTLTGNCEYIGVASIEEGMNLRKNGINDKILVFSGFFSISATGYLIEYKLIPIIHSLYQINNLQEYLRSNKAESWLKINSGMNRLGLNKDDFHEVYKLLSKNMPINAITHLAESENTNQKFTLDQLETFYDIIKGKNTNIISAFNSAASLIPQKDDQTNTIRVGISLYGYSLIPPKLKNIYRLKPAMSLHAHIIAINKVDKGETVGYNRSYKTKEKIKLAIISIGYGDGYPHNTPSGTPVMIEGNTYPIIGKVSMDMMAIDISKAPGDINIGTKVTLFGEYLPATEIANITNNTIYSLLTGISPRVKIIYN